MKKLFKFSTLLLLCTVLCEYLEAQNTFPSAGNAGIGTTTPGAPLEIKSGSIFTQVGGNAQAFQSRTSSAISSGFWVGNQFYAEQTGATSGDFATMSSTAVTSHASGNVALAFPVSFVHMHTGAGTLGEVHSVDSRVVISPAAGNITSGVMYYGAMGIFNGGTPTNTVQNGYGLVIAPFPSNVQNKYGVYINDATANNYFGGSVSIGTTSSFGYQLAVNGKAIFTKAVVKLFPSWPDYVFKKGYILPSLKEVEEYVKVNGHLQGMPSAAEVEKDGADLGANQVALLKQVEELTLYTIQLQKQLLAERKRMAALQRQVDFLKKSAEK